MTALLCIDIALVVVTRRAMEIFNVLDGTRLVKTLLVEGRHTGVE